MKKQYDYMAAIICNQTVIFKDIHRHANTNNKQKINFNSTRLEHIRMMIIKTKFNKDLGGIKVPSVDDKSVTIDL